MSIVTVGTVAFDAIETPFGKTDKIVGGAATYIAWAASYFTSDINMVSVIGDDFDMDELRKLEARGVDTKGIDIKDGQKSFFWSGKYHMDMNSRDTLATELNVLMEFNPILPKPRYFDAGKYRPYITIECNQADGAAKACGNGHDEFLDGYHT